MESRFATCFFVLGQSHGEMVAMTSEPPTTRLPPNTGGSPRNVTPVRRIEAMFAAWGWKPFSFQRATWRAYLRGHSGLLHSATGTGKTLAVWAGPLLRWMEANRDAATWNPRRPPPLRALWVTPLRALAGDTENALRAAIEHLGLPWRLERRTGDTKASVKARQLKRLPTALITTPESLTLMLTHERLLEQLGGLESVIVDEWHELLGTKRGIQTELALARLRHLNPALRTWGVSATLGNLDAALESLVGTRPNGPTRVIEGFKRKRTRMESIVPRRIERFPWAGHIGTKMVAQVAERIDGVGSALVFANTRSQTEIWYQRLLETRPDWAGRIALHHGSLDKSVRSWVEDGLRDGRLKAVVCTSSLDLGVDFTAVDLVIQIGSPKGAARLLQRAGRSGHQPDATSQLAFVPTNAIELLELSAAQEAIRRGELEARPMLSKPLDVLAQHAVTVAVGGGFDAESLLAEIRTTRAYESLTDAEWRWVLDFVVRGGETLDAYPEFRRVDCQEGYYCVRERRVATRHRLGIGTIVSDAAMKVKYLKGTTLGTAEESFLSKLSPGERFLFAGRLVELVRVRDNTAYVRRSKGDPDTVPRWMGGRMPLSSELSAALRRTIEDASTGRRKDREVNALRPLLELQTRWSRLPRHDELLVERIKTREVHQLFFFPFEGRLVHEGLAALVAYRLSRSRKTSFTMACNDYGFVVQSADPLAVDLSRLRECLAADRLRGDILECMNSTEMCKRQFRQIARIAGLVQPGYPGREMPSRHLQASSNLFFDVFQEYDPGNLLLEQGRREVLEQQLEASRMESALGRIEGCQVVIADPPKVTPLAFPLLVDKLRERVSSETLAERIAKLQRTLEKAAEQGSSGSEAR